MLIRDLPAMNAIKVGQLFLKPREIEALVAKSCRMLLFESDDKSLPLGCGGSTTLIRYKGEKLVAATRHQVHIVAGRSLPAGSLDAMRVVSASEDMLSNIPLRSVRFETSHPDEEFHDVLMFEAADEWSNQNRDRPHFFELALYSNRQRRKSFVTGYPRLDVVMSEYLNDFDPARPGTIHMKQALWDCILDPDFKSNARHYRSYKLSHEHETVDGLSGGAVFSLVGELDDLEIVLDGIVVRAGKDRVQIVDANYLIQMLEANLSSS